MQRVHRNLSRDEVQVLREKVDGWVPQSVSDMTEVLKMMRMITRKSQAEYARLCDVAPRVLADLEAGKGNPRVETLEKLLAPFGYKVGIVKRS